MSKIKRKDSLEIENQYEYPLELEVNNVFEGGDEENNPTHFLINSYIDISLNCIYTGMFEEALTYLKEGYAEIFVSGKKKKKTNI